MNAENQDRSASPLPSDQEVRAAGTTMFRAPIDSAAVHDRLSRAAAMLAGLASAPAETCLVYSTGNGGESTATPTGESILVGREVDGRLCFPDCIEMSRRHFRIERSGDHWLMEDLESRNGTFINGGEAPVQRRLLRDGDLLNAGGMEFLFVNPAG